MKDKKTKIINASDFLINEFLEVRSSKFDDKLAFILSRKATKGENCYGYENLAFCYLNGIGVKENTGKALKCFIKAAEGGIERAAELLDSICNRR